MGTRMHALHTFYLYFTPHVPASRVPATNKLTNVYTTCKAVQTGARGGGAHDSHSFHTALPKDDAGAGARVGAGGRGGRRHATSAVISAVRPQRKSGGKTHGPGETDRRSLSGKRSVSRNECHAQEKMNPDRPGRAGKARPSARRAIAQGLPPMRAADACGGH